MQGAANSRSLARILAWILGQVAEKYLRLGVIFCNCSLRSAECFQIVMVFPVLFGTFSPDLSLLAWENTPQSTGNGCRKSHAEILSIFMQPAGPGSNPGSAPGPGCIKMLKITWDFLQPFLLLWGVFSRAYVDKSGENVLKSPGNS